MIVVDWLHISSPIHHDHGNVSSGSSGMRDTDGPKCDPGLLGHHATGQTRTVTSPARESRPVGGSRTRPRPADHDQICWAAPGPAASGFQRPRVPAAPGFQRRPGCSGARVPAAPGFRRRPGAGGPRFQRPRVPAVPGSSDPGFQRARAPAGLGSSGSGLRRRRWNAVCGAGGDAWRVGAAGFMGRLAAVAGNWQGVSDGRRRFVGPFL
jgi:hypothetical protein